jgi:septum formation protein
MLMLVLASASRARRRLLEQAGIPHQIQISGVDEEALRSSMAPEAIAEQLALAKAQAVARVLQAGVTGHPGEAPADFPGAPMGPPVLGCDSLLEFEGEVFGKPRDSREAITRWQRMAGGCGRLHTGHALVESADQMRFKLEVVTTLVWFAALNADQIEAYVATGEPLACAGGFALEGRGGMVVERIEGCYSNVIGLSLPLMRRWLNIDNKKAPTKDGSLII